MFPPYALYAFFFFLLPGSFCFEVPSAQAQEAPFTFVERTLKLPKMTEGEKAPFSFEFTHTGTDTLQIGSLEMCHCTRATYPQNPMLPGEKGHIRGVFDSNGMVGHNEKVIHIWYNREKLPYKIRFLVKVKKKK